MVPQSRVCLASLFILQLCWLLGCHSVRSAGIRQELRAGTASGHYIDGVPFIRQAKHHCGPAALTSVARFYGQALEQDEIAREIFLHPLKGVLTLDVELYARRKGLWARSAGEDLSGLQEWLDRGVPVIVLQQDGPPILRRYHFLVLVGYDRARRVFLAHDGFVPDAVLPYRSFEKRWRRAGRWSLAAVPPDRVTWDLDAAGHNDLGVRYESLGRLRDALRNYEEARRLNSREPRYHFNRANVLTKLEEEGSLERAEAGYRDALKLNPEFVNARNNLAYVLMLQGKLDQALLEAERTVHEARPVRYEFWETLAEVHSARKEYEPALDAYLEATRLPDLRPEKRATLVLEIIRLEIRLDRIESASQRLQALLDDDPPAEAKARADELLRSIAGKLGDGTGQ